MIDDNINVNVEEEIQRIKDILLDYDISDNKIKILESIIENTAWMKVKLDGARDAVKSSNVVIPYDNGGGQKGLRENPLFKGYESLWKSYMSGMNKILETLPPEQAKEVTQMAEEPKTMLELVRNKHRKQA